MDLLTRIEASLEFMNDGGPIGDRVAIRDELKPRPDNVFHLSREVSGE